MHRIVRAAILYSPGKDWVLNFDDIEQQLIAWNVMFAPEVTINYLDRVPNLRSLQAHLRTLPGSTWSNTWTKSPKQEYHEKKPKKQSRTHNSGDSTHDTARLLRRLGLVVTSEYESMSPDSL